MSHLRRLDCSFTVAALLGMLLAGKAAGTALVTGRVTDTGSNGIAGVDVAFRLASTASTAASATTDASGNYGVSVDSANYDILVTPPASSGFVAQLVKG